MLRVALTWLCKWRVNANTVYVDSGMNKNNQLTVTELKTYLPKHPFTTWITQKSQMRRYDNDHNGSISKKELLDACVDYLAENAAENASTPSSTTARYPLACIEQSSVQ